MTGSVEQTNRTLDLLTPRERECLQLAAAHMNSKEIGRQLGITPKTVDTHMEKACKRLGVANRRAAVRLVWPSDLAGPVEMPAQVLTAPSAESASIRSPSLQPPWGALNTMKIAARLGWIFAIAVITALAFGSLLAGLHALKDLV